MIIRLRAMDVVGCLQLQCPSVSNTCPVSGWAMWLLLWLCRLCSLSIYWLCYPSRASVGLLLGLGWLFQGICLWDVFVLSGVGFCVWSYYRGMILIIIHPCSLFKIWASHWTRWYGCSCAVISFRSCWCLSSCSSTGWFKRQRKWSIDWCQSMSHLNAHACWPSMGAAEHESRVMSSS